MLFVVLVVGGCWLWRYRISRPAALSDQSVTLKAPAPFLPAPAPTKLLARTQPVEPSPAAPPTGAGSPEKTAAASPSAASSPASASASTPVPTPVNEGPSPAAAPTTVSPTAPPSAHALSPASDPIKALIQKAQQALSAGDALSARTHFAAALAQEPDGPESDVLRDELSRLSAETILSSTTLADDPLVDRYVIKDGDSLVKIAAQFLVPAEALARINGIADKNRIRAGQTIKVVKGPFRAQVSKSKFRLDLYLEDVLVKTYRVGLGADGSTPTGQWRVGTKLVNPTYYPARGGDILSADDPANPLGERWIGLVGVSGEAQGQERYGIHGTIEPDSIGKNTSMGCIRLLNSEVEVLYDFLVEKHSTIVITD